MTEIDIRREDGETGGRWVAVVDAHEAQAVYSRVNDKLVIIDHTDVPDALRGYKEIHLRALRLLKPGGTLATFCCSHHVEARLFLDCILSAAYDARRVLRRVATYEQSPDHPIIPSIPETEYLKGFAFELVR